MITEFEKYNESLKDFQYMIEPEDMKYIKEPVVKVFIPEMFNRLIHRPEPFTFKEQKYILLYTGGTMLRKKDTAFDYSPKQWIAFRVEKHLVTVEEGSSNIYVLKVYSGEKVDVDPYGEEDWPGKKGNKEISIYIKKHSYTIDKYRYYYTIDINNERMDASESLIKRICELLDEPRNRRREARKRREEEDKKVKHDKLRGDLF